MRRAEIVREARRWVGTPYQHQAGLQGVGCDCASLVISVGRALNLMPDWTPERFAPYAGYGRAPNPRQMREAISAFFDPVAEGDQQVGDIAWIFWARGLPMHMALLGEFEGRQTLIHAYAAADRVVEHGFTTEWLLRVHSWWRYRGLRDE